ncbi:unnamed protein product [Nippostrongylus brasiliensis]|uniref:PABS domain-containing protein n=1 Tax=Nippostrongylus brasiliensis TaxID=27835 RepID=A0A0N4XY85_NIPBR|nr:unnamed protein product [Nippostrongylus brasiliensis]
MVCMFSRVCLIPLIILLGTLQIYISMNKLSVQSGPQITGDASLEDLHIEQLVEEFKEKYGMNRVMYSFWRVVFYNDYELTSGLLKAPTKKIGDYIDTTMWEVDMTYMQPGVVNDVVIREMFVSGAIEMSRDAKANVLVIGMGAGHINTLLYLTYPNLNITAIELEWPMIRVGLKWFGLKIDGRHTVEAMDGISFLKKAAISGHKYDVIHIDACVMSFEEDINCPTKAFLPPLVVKNIHRLLSDKGVQGVKDAYKKYFRECKTEVVPIDKGNVIVSCTKQLRPKGLKEKYNIFLGRKEQD